MSLGDLVTGHSVGVALVAAFASACTFALGTSLQHRAGGTTPHATRGALRVLRYLIRQPSWLLGIVIAAVGLVLHAVALHFASLAIVQPMMVAGVALAVPLRAALSRHLPSRREMYAVLTTTVGLAVFLVAASPEPRTAVPGTAVTIAAVLGGMVSAVGLALIGSRMHRDKTEALLHGIASGVVFGLSAALLKMLVIRIGELSPLASVTWPIIGLVVVGALGISFNQRAYRIARLSASMPASNVVAVLTAILLGAIMFGEAPASGVWALGIQCLALACMASGLRGLARLHEPAQRTGADEAPGSPEDIGDEVPRPRRAVAR